MDHLKFWVNNLINTIENKVDKEIGMKIIENCGRICANDCGSIKKVDEIIQNVNDNNKIELIINEMNKNGLAGGKLKIENRTIYGIYEKCYCPSRKDIKSPFYCNCTKGWIREVFERILGNSIDVKLEKAIAWGDEVCKFIIKY